MGPFWVVPRMYERMRAANQGLRHIHACMHAASDFRGSSPASPQDYNAQKIVTFVNIPILFGQYRNPPDPTVTAWGVVLSSLLPTPSCPLSFRPQHLRPPPVSIAHVKPVPSSVPPANMAVAAAVGGVRSQ